MARRTKKEQQQKHFQEQENRLKKATPYIKLLSAEIVQLDGLDYVEEKWLKSQWPSPTERVRRYPVGENVSSRPTRTDNWIIEAS